MLTISCRADKLARSQRTGDHDIPLVVIVLQHITHKIVLALIDTPGHPLLGAGHRKAKLVLTGLRKSGIAVVVESQLVEWVWKAVEHPLQVSVLERSEHIHHPWLV